MFPYLLVAFATATMGFTTPTPPRCPTGCNCTDMSLAICDSLDIKKFGLEIFSLKVVGPKRPLTFTNNLFENLGLESLSYIHIENATILDIEPSAFSGLSKLISLSIINSSVPRIGAYTFANLTKLRTLKLAGTPLKTFEFLSSPSLEELDLSRCKLTSISTASFANLPEITYLNLEGNNIKKVEPLTFSYMINLEEINLSKNNISNLPSITFEMNTELVTLDLSNNNLITFEVILVSELETLILKSNKLKHFNITLNQDLQLLSYLDLSYNNISNLRNDVFDKMTELAYLDLSGNNLKTLDKSIFKNNTRLQRIILDHNYLKTIPEFTNHKGYFETYYFSCNNCNLTELPQNTFKYLSKIITLQLSNNTLSIINPEVFHHISNLLDLDLSNNNISYINQDLFSKSAVLEKVTLAGNPLKSLDSKVFRNNKFLKHLDVSTCKLEHLWKPSTAAPISSLQELNIAHNELHEISPIDLQMTPNIRILNITSNPLECSQSLRDGMTWLTDHEVKSPETASFTKTHIQMNTNAISFETLDSFHASWRYIIEHICDDDYYFDENDDKEFADPPTKVDNFNDDTDDDDNYSYLEDEMSETGSNHIGKVDEFTGKNSEIDIAEIATLETRYQSRYYRGRYSFLWPTLVFIFTACSVLIIVANIILLVLKRKGALDVPRHVNMPHFKIPQWGTGTKLKKHSGSVYQPLSEDRSGPRTPIINRYARVPDAPGVHTQTP